MAAFKLDYLQNAVNGLPILAGTHTYLNRPTEISSGRFERAVQTLEQLKSNSSSYDICSALQELLLKEQQTAENYAERELRRYTEVFPGVSIDSLNILEACGCMRLSKKGTIIYSFHDKFACLLAFLFHEQSDVVEANLRANCEAYGVNYDVLSYAFCTYNVKLIESINLQVFSDVCEMLDLFLQDIFWYTNSCIYTIGDTIIDLADTAYTPEERITTYLVSSIAYVQQNLLNQIIGFFQQGRAPFVSSRYCVLASKGFSNVVITAYNTAAFPDINVQLDESISFCLHPLVYTDLGGKT